MNTRRDLADMIDKMQSVSSSFYVAATRTGCHGFIEFCGLMNEYIKICEQSLKDGVDFSSANKHNERALSVQPFNIDYIVEKLDCIFGPAIRANPETKAAFRRLVEDDAHLPSPAGGEVQDGSAADDDAHQKAASRPTDGP